MNKSNLALNLVLLTLGILILTVAVFLPGCGRHRNHVYTHPAAPHHNFDGDDYLHLDGENYLLTPETSTRSSAVTPPALSVTPDPLWPWLQRRSRQVESVPVVPVVPVHEVSTLMLPNRVIDDIETEDDSCEAVFAYASADIALNK